ncbi:MAG: YezD family protein [Verrucomicrobiota bacterium]|jgi:hypothetical protein
MAFRQTFRAPYDGDWQQIIRHHVNSLHYGSVEIVVHDSRIVQVDITERFRFVDSPRLLNHARTNGKQTLRAS